MGELTSLDGHEIRAGVMAINSYERSDKNLKECQVIGAEKTLHGAMFLRVSYLDHYGILNAVLPLSRYFISWIQRNSKGEKEGYTFNTEDQNEAFETLQLWLEDDIDGSGNASLKRKGKEQAVVGCKTKPKRIEVSLRHKLGSLADRQVAITGLLPPSKSFKTYSINGSVIKEGGEPSSKCDHHDSSQWRIVAIRNFTHDSISTSTLYDESSETEALNKISNLFEGFNRSDIANVQAWCKGGQDIGAKKQYEGYYQGTHPATGGYAGAYGHLPYHYQEAEEISYRIAGDETGIELAETQGRRAKKNGVEPIPWREFLEVAEKKNKAEAKKGADNAKGSSATEKVSVDTNDSSDVLSDDVLGVAASLGDMADYDKEDVEKILRGDIGQEEAKRKLQKYGLLLIDIPESLH